MTKIAALEGVSFGWGRALPMIYQSEAAECGLVCMAMAAQFHGLPAEVADLRRSHGMSLKGARLADLVDLADRVGFATRAVTLQLDELKQLQLPCILHWDMNHFVVLREVGRSGVVVHDPAVGVRKLSHAQLGEHFTGVALELTPVPGFAQQVPKPRLRMFDLLGHMVGLKRSLGQVFLLALAIEVLAVASPFFLQWVVDHALLSADRDLLLTLALGFGLLMLVQVAVTAMRSWSLMTLSTSVKLQGRANLFTHLQRLPAAFFEARHLGDIVSRFGSLGEIQRALTADLIEALLDGVLALVTLAIMFMLSAPLAWLVLLAAALYAALRLALYTPLRQASMESIMWSAKRETHFLETLRSIKTIKLFNGAEMRRAHWMNLSVEAVNRELAAQKLRILFRTFQGLLLGALTIVVVWLGALYTLDNVFTVGVLLAFIAYKNQFVGRVGALTDKLVDLRMLRLHGERLADIAQAEPESRQGFASDRRLVASLELRDIQFRYSERDPLVLDRLSLKIEPGESVAIVGPSGCGKTTLLKICASLVTPSGGELLVGGEPLSHVGVETYRRAIGVVMQDDQLLAGSIAQNIAFFADVIDREQVQHCARLAAVHDDILAMPMGYESLIGDMGSTLSGGQKQRVLLARALYRRPSILLLDEATSHLDVDKERQVNDALRAMRMTRVIVAHRPETIRSADRVIDLGAAPAASLRNQAAA